LKLEITPREDHQVTITAEFDSQAFEKYKHQAAKKISQNTRIPGFRPGKAPYELVVRVAGEELVEKQAIELLIDEEYAHILEEAKVEPAGPGTLEKIVSTNPPTLSLVIPLMPVVELGQYQNVRFPYQVTAVSEEEEKEVIRNLQSSYSTAEPADRPVESGDLVYISLTANDDDEVGAEIVKQTSLQVIVGNSELDPDDWPFDGFAKNLIGHKENDDFSLTHEFSEETKFENFRNKKIAFKVQIESIKSLKLPDLDDNFAKSIGEFETFDAVRSAIRKDLEERKRQEYEQGYFSEAVDQIVGESKVKYPPQILEQEIEEILQSLENDLSRSKMDLETYFKVKQTTREDFIANELTPLAKKRLARGLVLDQVAREEKIQIANEELENAVKTTLLQLRNSPEFKKIKSEQAMRNLSNAVTLQTAKELLNRHVQDRVITIAKGEPIQVSSDQEKPLVIKKSRKKKSEKSEQG
jgi:trigger factor